jgi:hypothetical protein
VGEEQQVVDQPVTDAPAQAEVQTESNDSLEAGFAKVRPSEQIPAQPAPAAKEEPAKVEGETKVEEKKDPPPDPWANVPPVVRETLDSVQKSLSAVDNLSQRFRAVEGHVGGVLQKVKGFETAMAAAKTVERSGGAAPSEGEIKAASSSGEKWKSIVEMYPEWAEAMEERLAGLRAAEKPSAPPVDIEGIRKQIEQELVTPLQKDLRETREEMVAMRHPKWREDAASEEFKAWFQKQTPDVQVLAKSPLATKTIELFDKYAEARKRAEKEAKDKQRLENAVTPSGVVVAAKTEPDADAALERGFNNVRSPT